MLGGTGDDRADAMVVDAAGNLFLTGQTTSTNFPTTPGSLQTTNAGGVDAFLAEFNAQGALVSSSYFGGSGDDFGSGIALDSIANIYVAGTTASTNFPTTPGALQTAFGGGSDDGFVFKVNELGTVSSCNTISISGSMGGNLPIAAGSTVQAGYDFTIPRDHPGAHLAFTNANLAVSVTCPHNNGHPPTIRLPTQTLYYPPNN